MSEAVIKGYVCKSIQAEEGERTIVAVITSEDVDRDGEVVIGATLRKEAYRRNPVVIKGHDRSILVGKNEWIKEVKGQTLAKTKFADTDTGREEYALYKGGFKNAFSIGFIPDRQSAGPPTQKELQARPDWAKARTIYRGAELFEYSTVILPCNPHALALAYHEKSLAISPETAKELGIPETPPAASTKVYSFVSESTLKASLDAVDWKAIAEKLNRKFSEQIPAIVKDALHVARGGV